LRFAGAMSVQVQEPITTVPRAERRQSPRFRLSFLMPAFLGRRDAIILDISAEGARVMHFAALPLGSQIRLVFSCSGRRFAANARVLASRVMGLGNGPDGTPTYQSRLQFVETPEEAARTLIHIVEQIESEREQTWQANADGTAPAPPQGGEGSSDYFVRCRYLGGRWLKTWTRLEAQPNDGFTVPAKLSDGEMSLLCEAYEKFDADGRDLIRATAASAS
jgi:hypothetical protein